MKHLTPVAFHSQLCRHLSFPMAFDPERPFQEQQVAARELLQRLLGMPEKQTDPVPHIEWISEADPRFLEIRFSFETEPGLWVPVHMLLPRGVKTPLPVAICLQGHTPGMHVSLGRNEKGETVPIDRDHDFALQAVRLGFAAVAMEQRGFGELTGATETCKDRCWFLAEQAILLGRTLVGERCFDVSQLICALRVFEQLDLTRVGILGNSGGGTTSYYAAAMVPEITATMPCCAFRRYEDGQMARYHCLCGYVPGILKYMDMPDVAMLIAPKPMVIVAGETDNLASLPEVKRGYETVKAIYQAAGAPENCKLVVGAGGHRFFADLGWDAFMPFLNNKEE